MEFLSECDFDIKNIKGKENKVVDDLVQNSRPLYEIGVSKIKHFFVNK